MNKFELFTMIFFALDAYYEEETADPYINTVLSDMCPFTFKNIGSADPAVFTEFCDFIGDKIITLENSLDIAREYIKTIDYADVTDGLKDIDQKDWIEACKEYLSTPHKGMDNEGC